MTKVKIKLHPKLAKKGLGFYDPETKKTIKHKDGETITVEQTPFIVSKTQTGEIIVIETIEDSKETKEEAKKGK